MKKSNSKLLGNLLGYRLFSVLCLCVMLCFPVAAAEPLETDIIGEVNHCEWESACIYARNVWLTVEDVIQFKEEGTLDEWIMEKSDIEVRVEPSYQLVRDISGRADTMSVHPYANEEGYPVRLFIDMDTGYYIDILVYVSTDSQAGQESETTIAESISEGGTTAEQDYTEETSQEVIHEQEAESGKEQYALFLLPVIGAICLGIGLRKEIHILRWYKRKLKEVERER